MNSELSVASSILYKKNGLIHEAAIHIVYYVLGLHAYMCTYIRMYERKTLSQNILGGRINIDGLRIYTGRNSIYVISRSNSIQVISQARLFPCRVLMIAIIVKLT